MARLELARCLGSWFVKFALQGCKYVGYGVFWRAAELGLVCIGNVSNDICQKNAPGSRFIDSTGLPHSNLEGAVKTTLRHPCTEHLSGIGIALSSWWDAKGMHRNRGLTSDI